MNDSNHNNQATKSNFLFEKILPELYYSKFPQPILIGDKLRNADNIGAIIRLADNIGAKNALFLGDPSLVKQSKIQRCAASSYRNIEWYFTDDQKIESLLQEGYELVCIETAPNATNIYETLLPQKPAFIVGNEVHGIRQQLLDMAAYCIYIPVPGSTRSLNVSHAMGIAVFEWWRQMQVKTQG